MKRILSLPEKTKLMKEGNKSNTFLYALALFYFSSAALNEGNHKNLNVLLLSQGHLVQLLEGELESPFSVLLLFHLRQVFQ